MGDPAALSARARRGLRLAARRGGERGVRLSAIDRRDARLERLRPEDGDWHEVLADPRSLDALEALRALASLPERRHSELALRVAGYNYEEIRARTPGRTRTDVSKSLVKARARIRRM